MIRGLGVETTSTYSRSTHGAATASTCLYFHEVPSPASLLAYVAIPEHDAK